ncbi:MAG: hypothetical protein EXR11_07390 [Rhodospirillaceae bacterium]|nr:hypothetical protein [Rhodospirillaceae bacterium]
MRNVPIAIAVRGCTFALGGLYLLLAPGTVHAVDLVNTTKAPAAMTIIMPEGKKNVTVTAGGTLKDVCASCTVQNQAGTKRDVAGGQVVTIVGSMLLVSGQP